MKLFKHENSDEKFVRGLKVFDYEGKRVKNTANIEEVYFAVIPNKRAKEQFCRICDEGGVTHDGISGYGIYMFTEWCGELPDKWHLKNRILREMEREYHYRELRKVSFKRFF